MRMRLSRQEWRLRWFDFCGVGSGCIHTRPEDTVVPATSIYLFRDALHECIFRPWLTLPLPLYSQWAADRSSQDP